ncbi:PREDICTED: uncharacterized protein LOC106749266 isoform X1 [Dinoponera quadriceps]|uniref:Uncharacterized protein LOC106749266 isoform X1 n=1 Tax=Dinoponera quadriceps TaxID=609295 RepID=A0A6P3XZQ5_DINQU|nr:PREDICTED: uncharacterized protein LOC106749266 isoform X1 [Dinoponera quadriceps]
MIPRGNVRSSVFLPEISLQDRRDDCLREKTRIVARRSTTTVLTRVCTRKRDRSSSKECLPQPQPFSRGLFLPGSIRSSVTVPLTHSRTWRLGNHTESNSPREVDECQFR